MPFVVTSSKYLGFFYDGSLKFFKLGANEDEQTDVQPNSVQLPVLLTEKGKKAESESDEDAKKKVQPNVALEAICGQFSNDEHYLAVCDNKKRLLIWDTSENGPSKWILKHTLKVHRKCVKVLFTSENSSILVADRSGDVYLYQLSQTDNQEGQLLLGHLSMLLDMCLSRDERFILTSDRDEKIRVSHFPNSYNIETYCLGHTEFVGTICLMNESLLVSGGGDGCLKVWNFEQGLELSSYNCSQELCPESGDKKRAIKASIKVNSNIFLVNFYGLGTIYFYQINPTYQLTLINSVQISSEPLCSLQSTNGYLIALTLDKSNPIACLDLQKAISGQSVFILTELTNHLRCEESFKRTYLESGQKEELDLSGLYKTWFDNVDVYLKKKKERELTKRAKRLATVESQS